MEPDQKIIVVYIIDVAWVRCLHELLRILIMAKYAMGLNYGHKIINIFIGIF